jgi:glycine/D-amino acid oxidase-like deaminating enzyme
VAIAILGAGLQGTCIALELARRGHAVDLVDQDTLALNRASLRNEGKVHLGFVYAKDESLRTARLMVRGALAFRRLLARWTDGALERLSTSSAFHYLVPHDSALAPAALASHYAAVARLYDEARHDGGDYLGVAPDAIWRPLRHAEIAPFAAAGRLKAGFATVEASIDLSQTVGALRGALATAPRIRLHLGRRVRAVTRGPWGFRVEGEPADGTSWRLDAEQVVNALWDGRLVIDRGLGLEPPRPWVHRLKYRVMVRLPDPLRDLPSMSFVLGPYGDVGVYPGGEGYVSWYPECLRGWSRELAPPADWTAACTGGVGADEQAHIGRRVLDAFDALVPGLAQARIRTVDAGVIFSWGETDITDPGSALHRRDDTGVVTVDGYHSVNTGKLTTAPLFAVETADRVEGRTSAPPGA